MQFSMLKFLYSRNMLTTIHIIKRLAFISVDESFHPMSTCLFFHHSCDLCQNIRLTLLKLQVIASFYRMIMKILDWICIILLSVDLLSIDLFHLCYRISISFTSKNRTVSILTTSSLSSFFLCLNKPKI